MGYVYLFMALYKIRLLLFLLLGRVTVCVQTGSLWFQHFGCDCCNWAVTTTDNSDARVRPGSLLRRGVCCLKLLGVGCRLSTPTSSVRRKEQEQNTTESDKFVRDSGEYIALTVTSFRSISVVGVFRRHLVGKTLRCCSKYALLASW